jgi:hypothetical protein
MPDPASSMPTVTHGHHDRDATAAVSVPCCQQPTAHDRYRWCCPPRSPSAAAAKATPLPAAATSTQIDGYTLKLGGGAMMATMTHALTITISKNGARVTDLQPYLDTYAYLTAFHARDLAIAYLHARRVPAGP